MPNLKFFQIGKANEEIDRLNTELSAAKERIQQLEAAGGSNNAEIVAEAERLTGENAGLKTQIETLTGENTTLKGQVTAAQAAEASAKAELKTEKDGFEAKVQQRVQASLAALGNPSQPAPGDKKAKAANTEVTGYDRLVEACRADRLKATGATN